MPWLADLVESNEGTSSNQAKKNSAKIILFSPRLDGVKYSNLIMFFFIL